MRQKSEIVKEEATPERKELTNYIGQAHLLSNLNLIRVEGIIAKHIGGRDWLAYDDWGRFRVTVAELRAIKVDIEAAVTEGQRLEPVVV